MALDGAGERDDGRSQHAADRRDFYQDSRTEFALARVEGKLDSFMQIQRIRDEAMARDMKYIRDTHVTTSTDHESRIRTLEGKRYVEPKTVWTTFSILTAVSSVIVAVVSIVTR